jgi:hypothetical protein
MRLRREGDQRCADDGQRRQGQAPRSGDLATEGDGVTIAKV